MALKVTVRPARRARPADAGAASPRTSPGLPDVQVWIPAIRAGDVDAFESLFRTLYVPVTGYLQRIAGSQVAEELAQDVFVALWAHRTTLDPGRSIRSYLFRAAHNAAVNHVLRQRRERAALRHAGGWSACTQPVDLAAVDELSGAVRNAMATLSPRCREVYVLSRERHMNYAEIAHHLGISPKTVENHLGRSLRQLRTALRIFLD